MALHRVYNFDDVPTIRKFYLSNKKIRAIVGPYGSGKSSGCVITLLKIATEQQPDPEGVRYTRFVIIRNTYRQLKDTTKKTIDEWLSFAEWKESEHKYIIHVRQQDGTIVHSEWLLRALDRPEHVANLLSLEVTAGWINEAREIPKEIFDNLESRLRYPPTVRDSKGNVIYGPTWTGILLDTNPPDTDHWFYKYFEEDRPKKAEIFHQPSGLSPNAENLNNLPSNYYEDLMEGKDSEWIDVYIHGKYGSLREGMPVFTMYNDKIHCAKEPLAPVPGLNYLIIGMDFGLTPAAAITQQPPGRLLVLDEVVSFEPIDVGEFTRMFLIPFLSSEKYKFKHYIIIGDPAGNTRSQNDGRTCFQILNQFGIRAYPAYSNSLQLRLNAVNQYLSKIDPTSGDELKPAFLLSPTCTVLRKALKSKYRLKKISIGGERYTSVPVKDKYSHVVDALQYAALGHIPNSVNTLSDLPVRDTSRTKLVSVGYY